MPTQEQDFDKDILKMQDSFARLKREYDLFFAGTRKDPPHKEAKELDTLVRKWRNASVTKLATQFRLQSFLSSYTLQTEMWGKWMRQKEEGLARDPRLVAAVRKGKQVLKDLEKVHVEPVPDAENQELVHEIAAKPEIELLDVPRKPEPKSNGPARKLFDDFIKAKMDVGELPDADFAAFERKLLMQKEEIARKYSEHEIVFSVVVKEGKVSLKAKVVKKKQ